MSERVGSIEDSRRKLQSTSPQDATSSERTSRIQTGKGMSVLVAMAHMDDELSCGGTINKLSSKSALENCFFAVFSERNLLPRSRREFKSSILYLLNRNPDGTTVENLPCRIFRFEASRFPEAHLEIRLELQRLREELSPSMVFTHTIHDLHQDHRTIGEEVRSVFRDSTVVAGELGNSENGFEPNMYVRLESAHVQAKIRASTSYLQEKEKFFIRDDHIWGMAKFRGTQVKMPLAEAFEIWRMIM